MRQDELNCAAVEKELRESPAGAARQWSEAVARHIDGCEACADRLLAALLEEAPAVTVPDGFAARVAARVPVHAPAPKKAPRFAVRASWLAVAAAIAILLVLELGGHGWFGQQQALLLWMEVIMALEIGAVGLWLGRALRS